MFPLFSIFIPRRTKTDIFNDYFRSGKHLLGYSAGSISLSSRYIHVAFFREVLIHWTMLLQADDTQKKEFKEGVMEECPSEHKEELKKVA